PDGGKAAVADRDIDGLARGSRAVEEKTAADQDVMARAQVATGPLSSTPLPSGLLLGGKLRPCVLRSGSALPPGYEPITLFSGSLHLLSPRAFTPIFANDGPPPAVETETIDRRGRGERAVAKEAAARPREPAFFQARARGGVAPPRAPRHHVVTEVVKGVIDHRARGFGGVAPAPEWNAEPIADLGWFLAELGDPASADHGAAARGDQEHDLATGRVRGGDETLRVRQPLGVRNAQRILRRPAVVDERGDRSRILEARGTQDEPRGCEDGNAFLPKALRRTSIQQRHCTGSSKARGEPASRLPLVPRVGPPVRWVPADLDEVYRLLGRSLRHRQHRYEHAALGFGTKLDATVDEREQGMVLGQAYIGAGVPLGAALARDDVAGKHVLAAENLQAEPLTVRVAAVAG